MQKNILLHSAVCEFNINMEQVRPTVQQSIALRGFLKFTHRQHNSNLEMMTKINQNLTSVFSKFKNATYILANDVNLSCIDWQTETLISNPINGANDTNHGSSFLDTMNELGLSQHCNKITHPSSGKTLDLLAFHISRPAMRLRH